MTPYTSAIISLRGEIKGFIGGLSSNCYSQSLSVTSLRVRVLPFMNFLTPKDILTCQSILHYKMNYGGFVLKMSLRNRKWSLILKRMKFLISIRKRYTSLKTTCIDDFLNRSMTMFACIHVGRHFEGYTYSVNRNI